MASLKCIRCDESATFKCERCFDPYCSRDCQIVHWPEHKIHCIGLPNLIPIEPTNTNENSGHKSSNNGAVKKDALPKVDATESRTFVSDSENLSTKSISSSPSIRNINNVSTVGCKWRELYTPSKNFFKAIIQYVETTDNARFIWITDIAHTNILLKLLGEMNRSIKHGNCMPMKKIEIGSLVAAPYEHAFCRAEILDVNDDQSAVVRLIDYGNKLRVPVSLIYSPIPTMGHLNTYTMRVKVDEGYESDPLEIESYIEIRIIGERNPAGYYNVECKRKSIPLFLPLNGLTNEAVPVSVVKYFQNGRHALVRVSNGNKDLEDDRAWNESMKEFLQSASAEDFNFKSIPNIGEFVVAETKCGWRRCRLLAFCEEQHMYVVYALDDGFVCLSTQIKSIPNNFIHKSSQVFAISIDSTDDLPLIECTLKHVPGLVLKSISNNTSNDNNSSDCFKAQEQQQQQQKRFLTCALYNDTTKLTNVTATVFTGFLDELKLSKWHESIEEGSCVYISHILSYKQIFIAAYSTYNYPVFFESDMENCPPFDSSDVISIGDMVLVTESDEGCYRGEIIELSPTCKVLNIDRGYESFVERTTLRKPSSLIRSLPVQCNLVKLAYLENIQLLLADNKAIHYLINCVQHTVQFSVSYKDSQTVDLHFLTEQKESLCKALLPILFEPLLTKPNNNNQQLEQKQEDQQEYQQNKVLMNSNVMDNPIMFSSSSNTTFKTNTEKTDSEGVDADDGEDEEIEYRKNSDPNKNVNGPDQTHYLKSTPVNGICEDLWTLNDIQVVPINCGDNVTLHVLDTTFVTSAETDRCFYLCAADFSNKQKLMEFIHNLKMVSAYCKGPNAPSGPYLPKKNEVCLAIYEVDGEWYRALCVNVHSDDEVTVEFVDYGNTSVVNKHQIKPIIKDLMFPTYANKIYIKDIQTVEQANDIAKYIAQNSNVKASIRKLGNNTYLAKIHDLKTTYVQPSTSHSIMS